MKRVVLFCSILFAAGFARSQNNADIFTIDNEIFSIRMSLDSYLKVVQEKWSDTLSGGSREGYYKGKDLRMLVLNDFDKTGIKRVEYYFKDQKLIFAVQDHFEIDFQSFVLKEEKLYFRDKKLVKWIDSENKEINPDSDAFKAVDSKVFDLVDNLVLALKHK